MFDNFLLFIVAGLILLAMGMTALVLSAYFGRSVADKPQGKKDIDLSEKELGLIYRALSDSVNNPA